MAFFLIICTLFGQKTQKSCCFFTMCLLIFFVVALVNYCANERKKHLYHQPNLIDVHAEISCFVSFFFIYYTRAAPLLLEILCYFMQNCITVCCLYFAQIKYTNFLVTCLWVCVAENFERIAWPAQRFLSLSFLALMLFEILTKQIYFHRLRHIWVAALFWHVNLSLFKSFIFLHQNEHMNMAFQARHQ